MIDLDILEDDRTNNRTRYIGGMIDLDILEGWQNFIYLRDDRTWYPGGMIDLDILEGWRN